MTAQHLRQIPIFRRVGYWQCEPLQVAALFYSPIVCCCHRTVVLIAPPSPPGHIYMLSVLTKTLKTHAQKVVALRVYLSFNDDCSTPPSNSYVFFGGFAVDTNFYRRQQWLSPGGGGYLYSTDSLSLGICTLSILTKTLKTHTEDCRSACVSFNDDCSTPLQILYFSEGVAFLYEPL